MVFLSELSQRDFKFDWHRANSSLLTSKLFQFDGKQKFNPKRLVRMRGCARRLKFWVHDGDLRFAVPTQQEVLRGINAFCLDALCCFCQWRRSRIWKARAQAALARLEPQKLRYIFLTLTVRNCSVWQLREIIDDMNKAFRKLTGSGSGSKRTCLSQLWPGVGWVKSLEVTASSNLEAHPHFHVLLGVKPSYFESDAYIRHDKEHLGWALLWQEALGVNYLPSVHVRAVRGNVGKIVPEVFKYVTKESNLLSMSSAWLVEYAAQMFRCRRIALGGCFREAFGTDEEPEDLIGADDQTVDKSNPFFFSWNPNLKVPRYVLDNFD